MKKQYITISKIREIQKPKFNLGQLVRTSDIERVFSKGDSTNYSCELYTITENIHDRIPSYRIDYLPERYNENNQVMKKLHLIQ